MTGPSSFAALHLRRFGEHRVRTGLSLVGIAVGSALVVTLVSLFGSVTSSVAQLAALTGRADLEVLATTDAGFDQELVATVAAVPGVRLAAPTLRSPVVVNGRRATLFGADAQALEVGGSAARCIGLGRRTIPGDGVLLGPGVAGAIGRGEGDTVTFYGAGGRARAARVAGVITCGPAARLNGGHFAVAFLPVAQELAGKARSVDALSVVLTPGADPDALRPAIQRAVGAAGTVASPRLAVDQARSILRPLEALMFMLAVLTLVVAGFLVWNTMSMAALERRRELATLRALGATRRRLLAGVLAEACLLGLAGSAMGTLAGAALARSLLGSLPTFALDPVGVQPSFVLPPAALGLGVLAGAGATIAASLMPARAAVRVPPVEAFRPEGVLDTGPVSLEPRPVPVAAGATLFVAGIALALAGPGMAAAAGLGAMQMGFVLATFGLAGPLATGAAWLAARAGPAGRLASASIARAPRRAWTTTLAVSVSVGAVVTMGGALRNQSAGLDDQFASLRGADLWVQTAPANRLPTEVLMPAEWEAELRVIPGVSSVVAGQAAHATIGGRRTVLQGVGGPSDTPVFALARPGARAALLSGSAAIVSGRFASAEGVRAGDTLGLPTPGGPRRLLVGDVVDLVPTADQGFLLLPLDELRSWYGRPGATWFELRLTPGADGAAVRRAAERVVAGAPIPAFVLTGGQVLDGARQATRQGNALVTAMHVPIILFSCLAILNTLLISVMERRRELGIMRAVGTSRRQLRRMVTAEAGAVATTGAALGLALGMLGHRLMLVVFASLTGMSVPYRFTLWPLAVAAAAAVVLTRLGAAVPARRVARLDVIEAIGYE